MIFGFREQRLIAKNPSIPQEVVRFFPFQLKCQSDKLPEEINESQKMVWRFTHALLAHKTKNAKNPGEVMPIGGKVEDGKTFESAGRQKSREEVGVFPSWHYKKKSPTTQEYSVQGDGFSIQNVVQFFAGQLNLCISTDVLDNKDKLELVAVTREQLQLLLSGETIQLNGREATILSSMLPTEKARKEKHTETSQKSVEAVQKFIRESFARYEAEVKRSIMLYTLKNVCTENVFTELGIDLSDDQKSAFRTFRNEFLKKYFQKKIEGKNNKTYIDREHFEPKKVENIFSELADALKENLGIKDSQLELIFKKSLRLAYIGKKAEIIGAAKKQNNTPKVDLKNEESAGKGSAIRQALHHAARGPANSLREAGKYSRKSTDHIMQSDHHHQESKNQGPMESRVELLLRSLVIFPFQNMGIPELRAIATENPELFSLLKYVKYLSWKMTEGYDASSVENEGLVRDAFSKMQYLSKESAEKAIKALMEKIEADLRTKGEGLSAEEIKQLHRNTKSLKKMIEKAHDAYQKMSPSEKTLASDQAFASLLQERLQIKQRQKEGAEWKFSVKPEDVNRYLGYADELMSYIAEHVHQQNDAKYNIALVSQFNEIKTRDSWKLTRWAMGEDLPKSIMNIEDESERNEVIKRFIYEARRKLALAMLYSEIELLFDREHVHYSTEHDEIFSGMLQFSNHRKKEIQYVGTRDEGVPHLSNIHVLNLGESQKDKKENILGTQETVFRSFTTSGGRKIPVSEKRRFKTLLSAVRKLIGRGKESFADAHARSVALHSQEKKDTQRKSYNVSDIGKNGRFQLRKRGSDFEENGLVMDMVQKILRENPNVKIVDFVPSKVNGKIEGNGGESGDNLCLAKFSMQIPNKDGTTSSEEVMIFPPSWDEKNEQVVSGLFHEYDKHEKDKAYALRRLFEISKHTKTPLIDLLLNPSFYGASVYSSKKVQNMAA